MALVCALRYQSPTMKQKLVLLLVLTLSAWSPVFSTADTPETRRKEAERYLQVSPPKALFEDMADKMAANLPADQREQFKKLMTTEVDIAALSKAMIDAMVKNFTTEELKALADFYGSPVGKSAMQKFGGTRRPGSFRQTDVLRLRRFPKASSSEKPIHLFPIDLAAFVLFRQPGHQRDFLKHC